MSGRPIDGAARIASAIGAARAASRPAIAAFLTAGFPTPRTFGAALQAVAAEADIVELGVPFSDPMADGVTIQRASRAALAAGVTLDWVLKAAAACEGRAPILLMSYLNPMLAFGIDRLARTAREAGAAGFIVPDMPYEESADLRDDCDRQGLALVQLVTPVTSEDRLVTIARASRGFVYAVTATGTTGGRVATAESLRRYLGRVRAASSLPVLAGFGIRDAGQVRDIASHADGVVVGSALVEALERGEDPAVFLRGLREGSGTGARR